MPPRVELRWGPATNDLDLLVFDSDLCLTFDFLSLGNNCSDNSLAMNMLTPGPEIITWSTSQPTKKYLIIVLDSSTFTLPPTPPLINSEVSYQTSKVLNMHIHFFKNITYLCSLMQSDQNILLL